MSPCRTGTPALMSLLLLSAGVVAQTSRRPNERIDPGVLHLRRVDASVEFDSTVEQVRVRSKDGSGRVNARQTNRSALTQGRISLSLSGDIVHPYFIDFYGNLGIGFSESRYQEDTLTYKKSDKATGFLSEFDLRMDFLKTKPLSGTVYGQRGEDRIGRLFLPSLRERRTAFGTAWVFKDDVFPMQLSYDHLETKRTGNQLRRDDERIIEDTLRYALEWRISDHQKLNFDYEHKRTLQEYQGSDFDFDTRRNQVRLNYELEFGDDHQHRFETLVRVQDESGDLAQDIVEVGPQLTLQHTPNLETRYIYQFSRERLGEIRVDLHRAEFQLRHQFLENLTTTLNVFGLRERTDESIETTQGGGSIAWNYTRSNPYGQLTAELRLAGDSERTQGNNGLRLARDESVTFRDPLPAFLTKPNVAIPSILVTDRTGRRVYRFGSDYTIIRTRDRIALYRVPGGRIANGENVLIDYRYNTPAKGRIDTTRIDFSIQQAFSWGLTPYYRLAFRDQDVNRSSGFAFIPDRTDHHRLGVTFAKSRWSLSAEYEIYDDTINPYDGFHLTGQVQAVRSERQSFDLRGGFSQYLFDDRGADDREVSQVNLSALHEYRINDRWGTNLASTYRWEDDSVRGTTNGLDLKATVAYRRGNVNVDLTFEYDLLRIAGSKEDGMSAWVTFRWDAEDVLALE